MDPLTILGLIKAGTSLIGGLTSGSAARDQAEADRERANQAIAQATGIVSAAQQERENFGLSESFRDLKAMVNQDPMADLARRSAQQTQANELAALQGGGSRALLGGLGASSQRAQTAFDQIAADSFERRKSALETIGTAEERVATQRFLDARKELDFGRGLEAQGLQALFGAEDAERQADLQKRQGIIQAIGGGLSALVLGGDKAAGISPDLLQLVMKEGGKLRGVTPGEFSHEDNPIDIMQDGEKIGEMTGGEAIVSPEDWGELTQRAGSGNTGLHKYLRQLIEKIESNG
tara:strand:- start:26009 stop:26884 length:876 start_codon:yes stop_codon:yes gene_type:complete